MKEQFFTQLKQMMGDGNVLTEEPMSRHTTFRVGGPADVLVRPTVEQLAGVLGLCREYGEPYTLIGNGSNLLVGDGGIRGVVIELAEPAGAIEVNGNEITAQAGAMLAKIANTAAAGMEFASGIPGTIGGAVVMNAGAYGGEMKDILVHVKVLNEQGEEKELTVEELELGYRRSCILEKHYLITEATVRLTPGHEEEIRAKMKELNEKRIEKQPLSYPSAGSTFKRPEGYFAGKLIMDSGLRGYQVGGAQVSEKHCGFVINRNQATAADVEELCRQVAEKVKEQSGVDLEMEIKRLG